MAAVVIVHDVSQLSAYCQQLSSLKEQLQDEMAKLRSSSGKLESIAGQMGSATNAQQSNWQDPQYDALQSGQIEPCIAQISTNAQAVTETAAVINSHMEQVESSIDYINKLISKLNNI